MVKSCQSLEDSRIPGFQDSRIPRFQIPCFTAYPNNLKSGTIYEINRASVIGFRAIGKGRSAAEKCLSFFGLVPVYTWHQHTQVIEEKVKDQSETDFSNAVSQLKQFMLTTGEVDCTVQELANKVHTIP